MSIVAPSLNRLVTGFLLSAAVLFAGCSSTASKQAQSLPNFSNSAGEVVVRVPRGLAVTSVDGEDFDYPSSRDRDYQINLTPGEHALTVEYVADWLDPGLREMVSGSRRGKRIVAWQPKVITHTFKTKVNYQINYDRPDGYSDALANIKRSPIWLEASDGVAQSKTPGRVINKPTTIEDKPATQAVAVTQTTATAQTTTPVGKQDNVDVLEELKYWWEKASAEEKQQFWLYLSPK